MENIRVDFYSDSPDKIIVHDDINSHYSIFNIREARKLLKVLKDKKEIKKYLGIIGDQRGELFMGSQFARHIGLDYLNGNYLMLQRLDKITKGIEDFLNKGFKDKVKDADVRTLLSLITNLKREDKLRKDLENDLASIPF